jgi:exodeoxyribonuclease VII large subunit
MAARLVHPRARIDAIQARLHALTLRLRHAEQLTLAARRERLTGLVARWRQCSPLAATRALELKRQHLVQQLTSSMQHHLSRIDARLAQLAQSLHTLSPLATLARGYAIVQAADTGVVLRQASAVQPGERVRARLHRGELVCRVEQTQDV